MIQNLILECSYIDHKKKLITQICLNQDCQTKICCNTCVKQFHGKHLDDLMDVQDYENFRNNAFLEQSQFKKSISQALMNITNIKKKLETIMGNITINCNLNYTEMSREQLNKEVTDLLRQQSIQRAIENDLLSLNNNIEKIGQNSKILKQMESNIKNKQIEPNSQSSSTLSKIKIISVSQQQNEQIQTQFEFSKSNKHSSIMISENGQDAIYSGRTYGFAVSEQPLTRNTIIKVNFIIHKLNNDGGVFLGMGIKQRLIKEQFYPNLFVQGHGCYLIHSKGNCFSHQQQDINNKQLIKQLKEKQIIQMIVDGQSQQISWHYQLENTLPIQYSQIFVMKFTPTDDDYLVIGLYGDTQIGIRN